MTQPTLETIVAEFRANPGIQAKRALRMIERIFGPSDWLHGPGDDAAVVAVGAERIVAAGEAIYPPFVDADPFGAGVAAVVTNVSDVAAMGARPLALVDTMVGPEQVAETVLEGMRHAAATYAIPVVGGHLTVSSEVTALSAFIVGKVGERVLSVTEARPGQALLVAYCLEGELRADFPFLTSLDTRGSALAGDVELLANLADAGTCVAAKDISMGGLLGSVAMLLEPTGTGVCVNLDRVPRPAGVPLERWVTVFPTWGFLLCVPPDRVSACLEAVTARGLGCEQVGSLDDSGQLRARIGGHECVLADLPREGLTRAGPMAQDR
ncbi:MAG TPA: AIR synthase related protein [Jiangellaceae bacterium]